MRGIESVNSWVEALESRGLQSPIGLYLPAFQVLSKNYPIESVIYGEKSLSCVSSDDKKDWVVYRLAGVLRRIGRLNDALSILERSPSQRKSDLHLKLVDDVRLLQEGV